MGRFATTTWLWHLTTAGWATRRQVCAGATLHHFFFGIRVEVVNVSVPEGKVGDFAKAVTTLLDFLISPSPFLL